MGLFAITGAGSGIGAATRARLEKAGHAVVGIDLHHAEIIADLSTPEGRNAAIAAVLDRSQGHLDGLLTAAGVGPPFSAEQMVSINWFGTEALLSGLRVALANSRRGQVVAISSNSTTTMPDLPADLIERVPRARRTAGAVVGQEARRRQHLRCVQDGGGALRPPQRTDGRLGGFGYPPQRHRSGRDADAAVAGRSRQRRVRPRHQGLPRTDGDFGDPDEIAAWIEHMLIGDGCRFMCGSLVFVDGGTDAMVRADAWPATFAMPTGSQFGFD